MHVKTKDAGFAQFMKMKGAKLIQKAVDKTYIFESSKTRKEWRLAYTQTDYPEFNTGVIALLNLNKMDK